MSVIMVVACLTICSTLKRVNAEGGEEMSDSEVSYPSTTTIAPLLLPPPPLRFSRSRMGLEKRSSCWSSSLALVQGGGGQRRDGANLIITGRVEGIITAPSEVGSTQKSRIHDEPPEFLTWFILLSVSKSP